MALLGGRRRIDDFPLDRARHVPGLVLGVLEQLLEVVDVLDGDVQRL